MSTRNEVVTQFLNSLNLLSEDLILEPLKGGGSQATLYRFNLQDATYVLRLLPSQASHLTREHQITLAKQAGECEFGPKVHFVDPEMKCMVMEFIPGRTVNVADFEDRAQLVAFAQFIKRLHLSEVDFPHAVSPFKRFRDFAEKMECMPPRFSEVRALMRDLEALFALFPMQLVPSHLDLHPLNIMLNEGHFCLVDWVNGGMCDPWFDLATFSVFHELNEKKAKQFLTAYLERSPTESEWHRFIVTQPIRPLVIAVALFSAKSDQLARSMYESALALIDQVAFQEALNAIKTVSKAKESLREGQLPGLSSS